MQLLLKKSIKLLIVILLIFLINKKNTKDNEEFINEVTYSYSDTYNELKCNSILIIPKIKLNKCMNINDVNKDIAVIYDDKTTILAGHSGIGKNAYFKNLYKLKENDEIILYHRGRRKEYYVNNIKTKNKKDNLNFQNIENQLILITCSYTNKDEQIIYFLLEK